MRSKFKWIFTLLMALTMQFSFAQEKTVTGTVSDEKGPLPGANVVVKNTTRGVQTDLDGKYAIKVKQGETLVFTFVGMPEQVRVVGTESVINVKMSAGMTLDEVVVEQGYRSVTKTKSVISTSVVNSKTIENRPNANVINTLQGQVAGVNITAGTGQPGAKSTVIIRGIGSINGNTDPLYVIDGFPSNSDNFRSLNPNDIASVEVLKDAAATAEFGSRGSNGVIVIKTRKANLGEGKTTFRYSSNYGITQLQKPKYKYSTAKELLKIEQVNGFGLGSTLTDAQINAYQYNTDWVDYFFQIGKTNSHNFSVENSAKNVGSFTSLSYTDQEGVLITTGLKRFTVRNNVNGKSSNEKFKYQINTAVGFSKNNEATNIGTGAVNRNYLLGAYASAPYVYPEQYENSQQLFDLYQADGTLLYTPLFLIDKLNTYTNLTDETRVDVATDYSYKITKNLTARGKTSGQFLSTRFEQSEHPISFNAFLFLGAGQQYGGFEDMNQRREFLFNQLWQLDWNKKFGKHEVTLTANAEYNHSRLQTNNFRQRGLNPQTFVPNTGTGYLTDIATHDFYVPQVSASQLRVDLISYFASFDYDYNSKYGFVASARRDGSSRFPRFNSLDYFWSLGGRWNINKEEFMGNVKWINTLKLRGSIGTVGNQRIVDGTIYAGILPPAFTDVYAPANNAYNGQLGYGISFGYPDLQWEPTKQYNIGMDWEMFSKRFRGNFDYYNRKTTELFLSQPVSPSSGTTAITRNSSAFVINKGVELNLAYDLIAKDNLRLTVRGNGSYNHNELGGIIGDKIISGLTVNQNGHMIDEYYVYPYVGVDPATGDLLFQAADGTITDNPSANTDVVANGKNRLPIYQGGFGFDLDYKGFFTSASFTYAYKVYRFDWDLENLYDPGNLGQFTVAPDMINAWTPSNTSSDIPSITATNIGADDNSDRFIRDASYIRLRNLQIGYRFPAKLLKGTFIKDLSFTLQGENVFNITKWQGFDPESDRDADIYGYPTPRIYTFGVDLKF